MKKKKTEQFNIKAESFFDIARIMFVVLDDEGKVRRINKKGCEILEFSEKEILGKNWFGNFLPQRYRKEVKKVYEQLMARKIKPVEYFENSVLTKSGQERIIAWYNTVLRDSKKNIIGTLSSGEDITEKKEVEEKIEHFNLVLQSIRNVNQLIIHEKDRKKLIQKTCDILTSTRGYTSSWLVFLDENQKLIASAQTGLGDEFTALKKQMKNKIFNECSRRALKQKGVVVIKNLKSVCGRCPLFKEEPDCNAMTIRLEYKGKIYGLLSVKSPENFSQYEEEQGLFQEVAGDISFALHSIEVEEERKKNEKALFQNQELLKNVFESMKEGILVLDNNYRYTYWNKSMEQISNTLREEVLGKKPWHKFPFLKAKIKKAMERAMNGNSVLNEELQYKLNNEKEGWTSESYFSLNDSEGKVIGVVGVVEDITERKQIEKELYDSEAWFREVFEGSRDAIFITNEQSQFTAVNKSASKLTGYSKDELFHMSIPDIHELEDLHAYKTYFKRIMAGEEVTSEAKILCKDGHKIDAEFSNKRILIDGVSYMHSVARDITERKQAEESLRKSEERFRNLYDNMSSGCSLYESQDGKNFILVEFNSASEKMDNLNRKEMIGKNIFELFPKPFESTNIAEVFKRVWKTGKPEYYPQSFFEINGRKVWRDNFFTKLSTGELVVIYDDITERKKVEEALRESEERFRVALKNSPIVVWNQDKDLRYIWIYNPHSRFKAEETIGKTDEELLLPDDAEHLTEIKRNVLKSGVGTREEVRTTINGKPFFYDLTVEPLLDSSGTVVGITCASIEITERKKAEEALRESEEKLRNIVEHSTNLFYSHTVEHELTYLSPQSREFLQCEPEEAMIRWTEFATDNPVNKKGFAITEKAIRTGKRQPPYELELVGKKGKNIWVKVDEAPVVENGKTVAIVGSLTDITERRKAEVALRESEKRYRSLVINLPVGIFRSIPQGKVLSANPVMAEIYGYDSVDELLKVPAEDYYATNSAREKMLTELEKQDFLLGYETLEKRKDGSLIWVSTNYKGVRNDEGKICYIDGVIVDITKRKKAEEALKISEEKYRTFFKTTRDCVFITSRDGRWLDLNDAAVEIFGYNSKEELSKVHIPDLYAKSEDRKRYIDLIEKKGYVKNNPIDLKKKDGSIIHTLITTVPIKDEQGNTVAFQGTIRDVTEQKKAEEALRQSEERFRLAAGAVSDLIYEWDIKTDSLEWFDGLEKALGFEEGEIPYTLKGWLDLIHPDEQEKIRVVVEDHRNSYESYRDEYRIRQKDDTWRHWVDLGVPILNHQGQPVKRIGVCIDITEQKKAKEQIKKDLKEKEVLLKEIHHRVKNNLNIITSLLNLQTKHITNKEQALRAFHETRDRIYSMALVHDQLYQSDSFSRINMKSYIRTMVRGLISSFSRGRRITFDIKSKDIFLDINKAIPCGLILNEIITNALKHAFSNKRRGKIFIEFQQKDRQFELLVQDNGIGIPRDIDVHKIKSLGLRLIHLLTEQLEGILKIKIKNGTQFKVTFPVGKKEKIKLENEE